MKQYFIYYIWKGVRHGTLVDGKSKRDAVKWFKRTYPHVRFNSCITI